MTDMESLLRASYARHIDAAMTGATMPDGPRRRRPWVVAIVAAIVAASVLVAGFGIARITGSNRETSVPTTPSESRLASATAVPPNADTACRQAFGASLGSAQQTTVGSVRSAELGPPPSDGPKHPLSQSFGNDLDGDFAAWCWTGQAGTWQLWAVDAAQQQVDVGEIVQNSGRPPTGGPGLP